MTKLKLSNMDSPESMDLIIIYTEGSRKKIFIDINNINLHLHFSFSFSIPLLWTTRRSLFLALAKQISHLSPFFIFSRIFITWNLWKFPYNYLYFLYLWYTMVCMSAGRYCKEGELCCLYYIFIKGPTTKEKGTFLKLFFSF